MNKTFQRLSYKREGFTAEDLLLFSSAQYLSIKGLKPLIFLSKDTFRETSFEKVCPV